MKIQFKLPKGFALPGKDHLCDLDINPDHLVEGVRKKVEKATGIECHKLIYHGVTLHDEKPIREYDIAENDALIIQSRHYGAYLPRGVQPQGQKRDVEQPEMPEPKRPTMAVPHLGLSEMAVQTPGGKVVCSAWGEKGSRRQMEDEFMFCDSLRHSCPDLPLEKDMALMAVLDGHGGRESASFVKAYLPGELGMALMQQEEEGLSEKMLKKAVEAAYKRLDARIAAEVPTADGTCAVLAMIKGDMVYVANLGDSGAFLGRQKPSGAMATIPLSEAHKCWMIKEKDRIFRSGGTVENGRVNSLLDVSRSLGDIPLKKYGVLCMPTLLKFKMDHRIDQFVLLACDGFWNAWSSAEAIEMAHELVQKEKARAEAEGGELQVQEIAKALVDYVIEDKRSQDNVTAVLAVFAQ